MGKIRKFLKISTASLPAAISARAEEHSVPGAQHEAVDGRLRATLRFLLRRTAPCCELLHHTDGGLLNRVKRGDRLGIGLICALRHNQVGELVRDVHV